MLSHVCFCCHPTRPRSAMSLRSSRICLIWPLVGSKAEWKEPPYPPLATFRRSPSAFRSPWKDRVDIKFSFALPLLSDTDVLPHMMFLPPQIQRWKCIGQHVGGVQKFYIPTILPSSAVTVTPTGAKISLSSPLSPFSARTLSINTVHTLNTQNSP